MSSDLSSGEMSILERYLARKNAVPAKPPEDPDSKPPKKDERDFPFTIEDLVNRGNDDFYSTDKNAQGINVGISISLRKTLKYFGSEGVVASMPYLIGGLSIANTDNFLRKNWHTALSEEDVGIDKKGKFVGKGKPILIVEHGGGILLPDRIDKAYTDGLTPQNAARFTPKEFDDLLEGVLPSGERIVLYSVNDVKEGKVKNPFGRYAVWLPFETAKTTNSGWHNKHDFINNDLVIARAGTTKYLNNYFEKVKHNDRTVGNWHRFNEIDPNVPQGRVLFVDDNCSGLNGDSNLNGSGRFGGVAPEALKNKSRSGARK